MVQRSIIRDIIRDNRGQRHGQIKFFVLFQDYDLNYLSD